MSAQGQTVVCLSYRQPSWFERLAQSIDASTHQPLERVLVNQDMTDTTTTARAAARGWATYVPTRNLTFAEANNRAASLARTSHVVLVNNDLTIEPQTLRALWDVREHAVAGVVVRHPADGRVTHAGGGLDVRGMPYHIDRDTVWSGTRSGVRPCWWSTFACVQVRRDAWEDLGGLDEEAYGWGYEDLDFCLRAAEADMSVVVALAGVAWHGEFGTRKPGEDGHEFSRWCSRWLGDGRLDRLRARDPFGVEVEQRVAS